MRWTWLALLMLIAPTAAAQPAVTATAWDQSVAAEQSGDLPRAERIMIDAWGPQPENYWARLRLAYLALLQGRAEEARSRYQELRSWPEAAGDTDVVRGQASAVAALGWAALADGDAGQARASFHEALQIDPSNPSAQRGLAQIPARPRLLPEVWSGLSSQSLGRTRYLGWVVYGNLPVRLTDHLTLRASGRYMSMSERSSGSPWAMGKQKKAGWSLSEGFLSLGYERRGLAWDAVAAVSDTSDASAIAGGGTRLRLGSSKGLSLEGAFLHSSPSVSNGQLRPLLFLWLGSHVELEAGGRLTLDERGNSVSANAGASLVFGSLGLFLQGHLGDERWAFDFVGPSLMSFDAAADLGGSATITWQVSRKLRLAVQGEGERLHQEGARGSYWSVSGGIQVAMGER